MAQSNQTPRSNTTPTLRLSTLQESAHNRGTLRTLGLNGPGPRFARLRELSATPLPLHTSRGSTLPATGVTWTLAREGLAHTLLLGN